MDEAGVGQLREEFDSLFSPDPDDFERPFGDYPHDRLEKIHRLDLSYLKTFSWEGASDHPSSRIGRTEDWLLALVRNNDVPFRLFEAGLRLLADSILAYSRREDRKGELRYYPSVILTFWSAFETFVRFSSNMMLNTVNDVPKEVVDFLMEAERYRPVLDRYAKLLLYGYGYKVDKGSRHWQRLVKAKELRDYYTHLDVKESRSLSSTNVLDYLEAVLLGIIFPSSALRRTQLLGIYRLYWIWDALRENVKDFIEQPVMKKMRFKNERVVGFHCPFVNVDKSKFPSSREWFGAQ